MLSKNKIAFLRGPSLFALAISSLILFSNVTFAGGDELHLKDGKVLTDLTINTASYDKVKFKQGKVRSFQERDGQEVERIVWGNASSALRSGIGYYNSGDLGKALTRFNLEFKTDSNPWSGAAGYYLGLTLQAQAGNDNAKLAKAAEAFEAYIAKFTKKKDFYLPQAAQALSHCYLTMGDTDKSKKALAPLASGKYGKLNKLLGKLGQAQISLKGKDYAGARKLFGEVSQGSKSAGQKVAAYVGYARAQLGLNQHKGAKDTIESKVKRWVKESGETPAVAEAFIVFGDACQGMESDEDLTWAFLNYMRASSISGTGDIRAEALYKAKEVSKKRGQSDKAEMLAAELAKNYPNSPWNR